MAKIAYLSPNNIQLRQINPRQETRSVTIAGETIDLPYTNYSQTTNFYCDGNQIIGVGKFFDQDNNEAGCQVFIRGIQGPILVQDSYSSIKTIMDSISCADLCNEL
tara:strand:+ start:2589 stop:2906 length:318 start_codon:yes stop_codon:yes gene_type:complete